eukprot:CAMPEP_0197543600 /NCGR_PEP_ID=MMETSP1318-20131121/68329_1 /TAXON_ID=552666 /ORGANISM="Partenskyella glossopodia, Strain RCC365" /LENGTH=659 /DNA_ID=CAMNT_0043102951 /DNA_START=73 /DNA_END=2052 /DNA_ORIENTATION=-
MSATLVLFLTLQCVAGSFATATTKPRIYVGIPMNWPITKQSTKVNLRSLISTWGKRADVLRFYIHEEQLRNHPPEKYGLGDMDIYIEPVPMKRSDRIEERNIWEKSWRGWQTASRKYLQEADWFIKTDIDTFLIMDNVRAFLSFLDPKKPHYLGHTLMHEWDRFNLVFNSGVGYILSREALRRLGMRLEAGMPSVGIQDKKYQCFDRSGPLEDPNTAGCLREINILPGDTLDKQGRQRFNLFRPRDLLFRMKYVPEDWYWRNKMSIGEAQLGFGCCSASPLLFHNFKSGKGVFDKNAFHELEYVYLSQPYQAKLKAVELDPPSGNLYQFREKELSFSIDQDRNAKIDQFKDGAYPPAVRVGKYLDENPEVQKCFVTGSTCECNLPKTLPEGMTFSESPAKNCQSGARIQHGSECGVSCAPGYMKQLNGFDTQHKNHNKKEHSFKCDGGFLIYPRFECIPTCRVPKIPPGAKFRFGKNEGEVVDEGKELEIICTRKDINNNNNNNNKGEVVDEGKELEIICTRNNNNNNNNNNNDNNKSLKATCTNGRFLGPLDECDGGGCVQYTLKLEGSKYQMPEWASVDVVAKKGTTFHVERVVVGSVRDPVNNCEQYGHHTQLILTRTPGSDGSGNETVVALSCGNQDIIIKDQKALSSACGDVYF